jgi:L-lactate dehydrogenase complex protein LldG
MNARDEILSRIRAALASPSLPVDIPRAYRVGTGEPPGSPDVLARFAERVADYDASVHKATRTTIDETLSRLVPAGHRVVVPDGLPAPWCASLVDRGDPLIVDSLAAPLRADELDTTDAVITGCRVAIAETGTIVLDGAPDQGRRAITLVPDHHVVVVFAGHIVASVVEALARLDPARPLTFISGPSATSDIEFQRIQGVHGPRRLDVVVVDDGD